MAARRRDAGMPDLFAEILGGRAVRTLPDSVVRALAELELGSRPPGRFSRTEPVPEPWPEPPSSGHGWPSPGRSSGAPP